MCTRIVERREVRYNLFLQCADVLLIPAGCSCIVILSAVYRFSLSAIQGDLLLHQTVVAGPSHAYLFACRVCVTENPAIRPTARARIRDSAA